MSTFNRGHYFRSWMDQPRINETTNELNEEYAQGLNQFMSFASRQPITLESQKLFCPCTKCCNNRFLPVETVWRHLYERGLMVSYKIWYIHGEDDSALDLGNSSIHIEGEPRETNIPDTVTPNPMVEMVEDSFRNHAPEDLNETATEGRYFMRGIEGATQSLYDGCRDGMTPLSAASTLMNIKTDFNLPEDCVDRIAKWGKNLCPDITNMFETYSEVQKLVSGLRLPYEAIDVCVNNCMIYWGTSSEKLNCQFCDKPRYETSFSRTRVAKKKMWYLPIADRLKRLFLSTRTAASMRWHAEHDSRGNILHPSDAEAWRHFKATYPTFSAESRNVYLGLCTDGFNPFGRHGRQYSLWPVIITPYNLPPQLCMKKEFLFLSVLIPGPEHPKKALDIFLQPLIYELKTLWDIGVTTYDVSCNEEFTMRATLMWTISDFPAYGMLSGWTTHGRLACPCCHDDTTSFQLKNGRKTSWFDCHRRFLPDSHPYRRSLNLFTKNKKVFEGPPPMVTGIQVQQEFRDFGVEETMVYGGSVHYQPDGYGEFHNWHKKVSFGGYRIGKINFCDTI